MYESDGASLPTIHSYTHIHASRFHPFNKIPYSFSGIERGTGLFRTWRQVYPNFAAAGFSVADGITFPAVSRWRSQ